ncbi:unnamed protein product, partial [Timema podura]|nr:unnamed protein product [Timema podura]
MNCFSTPIHVLNFFNSTGPNVRGFNLDESPLANTLNSTGIGTFSSTRSRPTKFRSVFGGFNTPLTPSFGILPLDSTFSNDSVQLQMAFLSPAVVPSATLTEANDQKSIAKRQLISRKETPLQQSKPVFSQSGNTGNNSNIVSTPSPIATAAPLQPGQNVRRSSRLFSNSYSVK